MEEKTKACHCLRTKLLGTRFHSLIFPSLACGETEAQKKATRKALESWWNVASTSTNTKRAYTTLT